MQLIAKGQLIINRVRLLKQFIAKGLVNISICEVIDVIYSKRTGNYKHMQDC